MYFPAGCGPGFLPEGIDRKSDLQRPWWLVCKHLSSFPLANWEVQSKMMMEIEVVWSKLILYSNLLSGLVILPHYTILFMLVG